MPALTIRDTFARLVRAALGKRLSRLSYMLNGMMGLLCRYKLNEGQGSTECELYITS